MIRPKTEYVKKKLKQTKWKNRDYIEDLMKIEKFILEYNERPQGMAHAMMMHNWCDTEHFYGEYIREYEQILKELKPKKYNKYVIEKKNYTVESKKAQEKWENEEKTRTKKEKTAWKKAGGKS